MLRSVRTPTAKARSCSTRSDSRENKSPGLILLFIQLRFDRGLDFFVERFVVLQDFFRGVAALGKLRAFVVQPGAALLDNLFFQSNIQKRARRGDSLVVHDVEFGLGKR